MIINFKSAVVLFILLTCAFANSFAQETIEVTFDNGVTKRISYTDDPDRLPAWEVKVYPLTAGYCPLSFLGFNVQPKYRINPKLYIDLSLTKAYGSLVDENTEGSALAKPVMDTRLMGHYRVFSKDNIVKKAVPVDYQSGDQVDVIEVYKVVVPKTKQMGIFADLGMGYLRYGAGINYYDEVTTNFFISDNVTSVGMFMGGRLQVANSYQSGADGVTRSYIRVTQLYANVSFGLANNCSIYESVYNSTLEESAYIDRTSDFKTEMSSFGWRIGAEYQMGMKNTGSSLSFGLEFGGVPQFRVLDGPNPTEVSTFPLSYIDFKFGFSIGQNPWKTNYRH
ncbi:MAG: hypothetical protein ACI837_001257 [Crocinitomicaceae bacterium]|jgi:hypothetical protein